MKRARSTTRCKLTHSHDRDVVTSDLKRILTDCLCVCAQVCMFKAHRISNRDAGDDSTQIIVAYCLYLHNCLVRVKVNYELILGTFHSLGAFTKVSFFSFFPSFFFILFFHICVCGI